MKPQPFGRPPPKEEWTQPVPMLELRKFCRDADKVETTVALKWDWDRMHQFDWMKLGQVQLHPRCGSDHQHLWVLEAYLGDSTDFEHDSAHILRMELIGVQFESLRYGQTVIDAFINPNLEDLDESSFDSFNVPRVDYDPFEGATVCKRCKESHLMVREGHYIPPDNRELYELVKGKRIEIRTGSIRHG